MRIKWNYLLTAIWLLMAGGIACAPAESHGHAGPFLFSFFRGNGEDGLYLAHSRDGLTWEVLNGNRPLVAPQAGNDKLMRDPSIIQGPDGLFHMVWTVSWNEQDIGYASSPDLINWSQQTCIPVMAHESQAQNCWAPELFYDEETGEYLIIWSTTIPGRFPETDGQSNQGPPAPGYNHRMYMVTTQDFVTFSETQLFYDAGFNVIDGAIVRADTGQYILFLKDETNRPFVPQKNIRLAASRQAQGPYGPPSDPITGDYWAEGPAAIKVDDQWRVYFDKYRQHRYGMVVSHDLQHWTDWSDRLAFPEGARHGTIFPVSEKVLAKLLAL